MIIAVLSNQIAGQHHFNRRRFSSPSFPQQFNPQFSPNPQFPSGDFNHGQFNPQPQPFNPQPQSQSFNPQPQSFNPQPQNHPFIPQPPNQLNRQYLQVLRTDGCPSIEVTKSTADGWFGNFFLKAPSDATGAQVEVTFDNFVPAFAVSIFAILI